MLTPSQWVCKEEKLLGNETKLYQCFAPCKLMSVGKHRQMCAGPYLFSFLYWPFELQKKWSMTGEWPQTTCRGDTPPAPGKLQSCCAAEDPFVLCFPLVRSEAALQWNLCCRQGLWQCYHTCNCIKHFTLCTTENKLLVTTAADWRRPELLTPSAFQRWGNWGKNPLTQSVARILVKNGELLHIPFVH